MPYLIILKTYLPKLLIGLAISLALFSGYQYIKSIGRAEATQKYELIIEAQNKLITEKIANVELLANSLVKSNATINTKLTSSVKAILAETKSKPLTIVKDGECLPTQTFSDSFVSITNATNQAIKDSQ